MRNFINIFLVFLSVSLYSCFAGRVLKYNVADIKDLDKFDKVSIQNNPNNVFTFEDETKPSNFKAPAYLNLSKSNETFDQFLSKGKTVAFIVIKNDSILYENYFKKYSKETPIPSFSVSKSFISALIGIAIEEGVIKSTDELITNYIPELKGENQNKITIQHVLDMRAGFKFHENYFNPFSEVAKYYYGPNIIKYMGKLKAKDIPGEKFKYQSVNTQVLALILERATKKTVAQYLEEKIWKPLQMEYGASWNVDDKGTIKAFCCINAKARDFAKLGKLYLNNGNWEGKQIVPKSWVDKTLFFEKELNEFKYSNHWWHSVGEMPYSDTINFDNWTTPYKIITDKKGTKKTVKYPIGDSFARGVLGQHIYIDPKKNIIIVRLGKGFGVTKWNKLFRAIVKEN